MATPNLDRFLSLFDTFADKVVDKMDPLVESSSELIEKGLDKVAETGFKVARKIKEKKDEKARKDS